MPKWCRTATQVRRALRRAVDAQTDLVVTTGGTGIDAHGRDAGDDAGPSSTREVPGIAEAIRAYGVAKGIPTAALSRGLAGQAGRTLIVNLPGSPGGVKDGLAVLTPIARACPRPDPRRSDHARPDDEEHVLTRGWPVRLSAGAVALRPLTRRDAARWAQLRRRNLAWLAEWEATQPPRPALSARATAR